MIDLPSLFFGAFIGAFCYTLAEICKQTSRIISRSGIWAWKNAYLYVIWIELIVNLVFAIITILYLNNVIRGTFGFFFATLILWTLQTQILVQIIANRIGLIMVNRSRTKWMRLTLFLVILGVNAGVFVVWIPAQLSDGVDGDKARLNYIVERFEKSFFLAIHLGLNLFFLYLIRRLIVGGLGKYQRLLKMNGLLIGISTTMDAALLGLLSLSNTYMYVYQTNAQQIHLRTKANSVFHHRYVQFAPLAYTVKLYIELMMASLIAKVVSNDSLPGQAVGRVQNMPYQYQPPLPMGHGRFGDKYGSTNSIFDGTSMLGPSTPKFDAMSVMSATSSYYTNIEGRYEAPGDEVFLKTLPGLVAESSIIKTVTTTVVSEDKPRILSVSKSGSIKRYKSRLEAGVYDDWINDPSPPPPPPKDTQAGMGRSRNGRAVQPLKLTSRFNQRQR